MTLCCNRTLDLHECCRSLMCTLLIVSALPYGMSWTVMLMYSTYMHSLAARALLDCAVIYLSAIPAGSLPVELSGRLLSSAAVHGAVMQ